jgi:glycosyltransferase involved in cell wall biosynthesis
LDGIIACTIVAHNYLPLARLVARSFLDHHPNSRFVVAFIDRPLESRAMEGECFEILPISDVDFGDEGFEHMATGYNVTEFATSVKPYVLRHLVDQADCVLYLDPDIFVYAPLDPLIDATIAAGWSVTPHCLAPIVRNGSGPTEQEIMAAGVYNLGYIGVTPRAVPFLEWWAERLRRDSVIDPSNQLFTDQRWVDLAVPIFAPHIERSPAYNVAYWNLDQRRLWFDGDIPMVDDEPLRFFHFSGYSPKNPHWLSKYQPHTPRVLMSDHPEVVRLCGDYARMMAHYSASSGPLPTYGWADAIPGLPFTDNLRRYFRSEMLAADEDGLPLPPTPLVEGGAARFEQWLREVPADSIRRLPRYLDVLWQSRDDLIGNYPDVDVGEVDEYLEWVSRSGSSESASVRVLGSPLPPPARGAHIVDLDRQKGGVDLIGYFRAELGVGEAGRLLRTGLEAAGVPTDSIACTGTPSRQEHPFEASGVARYDTVIMSVNADQFGPVRHEFGGPFFDGRYVIGQWFWELEHFPTAYRPAFKMLHEVWVATEHIRTALTAAEPSVPIVQMPLPLLAPRFDPDVDRSFFGLDDRFTFLFTFDMFSVLKRKNPIGLIEAFARAFSPGEGPMLVIKTINGSQRLEELERLRWACRARSDIVLIDEYFDVATSASLTALCDCYVSLHRAEGLGLTMSEAMALGKPVIATAYSGNLDFMTPSTARLVPWTPAEVGQGAGPYPADATWAEPDLDAAAQHMREVYEDPDAAVELGDAARRDINSRFSPVAVGARMRQRLEKIWEINHG